MKKHRIEIEAVAKGSVAEEAGIIPGDALLEVNGQAVKDVFDYRFLISEENLVLMIEKKDGQLWEIEIEKDAYEELGLEFQSGMMDEARSCSNKCIFCFIDQLPKGMRDTLYFKDDDSRLSFLSGNYVTLTNISDSELDRIIRYRMSPINVSVHTTNPELRKKMLKNRFAGNVLDRVKKLVESGIEVNCQIVLCRGINDGAELDRTIQELSAISPGVRSISAVPVGITKYRQGLAELIPFERHSAQDVLSQISAWQQKFIVSKGSRLIYPADEFFILSGQNIPDCSYYEDFPQIENGVGLLSLFSSQFDEYMDEIISDGRLKEHICRNSKREVSIATGKCPAHYIRDMAKRLESCCMGLLDVNVFEISNDFFGENVTVTGLLTGGDLMGQLKGEALGEELLISRSMLKADEMIFLDDVTVEGLSDSLKVKVTVTENNGRDFIDNILGWKRH